MGKTLDFQTNLLSRSGIWSSQFFFFFFGKKNKNFWTLKRVHGPQRVKEALEITLVLGKFIDLSPKRSQLMSTMQGQLSPECRTPSIKMICPTHWTVSTKALDAIIKNYTLLIPALLEIHNTGTDEYALKAGGFFAIIR